MTITLEDLSLPFAVLVGQLIFRGRGASVALFASRLSSHSSYAYSHGTGHCRDSHAGCFTSLNSPLGKSPFHPTLFGSPPARGTFISHASGGHPNCKFDLSTLSSRGGSSTIIVRSAKVATMAASR